MTCGMTWCACSALRECAYSQVLLALLLDAEWTHTIHIAHSGMVPKLLLTHESSRPCFRMLKIVRGQDVGWVAFRLFSKSSWPSCMII